MACSFDVFLVRAVGKSATPCPVQGRGHPSSAEVLLVPTPRSGFARTTWTDYLRPRYWNFSQQADSIAADFLIPFGEFVAKYELENAVPLIYGTTGIGLGNITQAKTMSALQVFGTYMAQSMLGKRDSFHPATVGSQALYNTVVKDLGGDVLYSSTNHATGQITLITARQLLIAIEPTDKNMAPLDLENNEYAVSKFSYTKGYSGILNDSALAAPKSYFNMPPGAAPDNYLVLPNFPFT
ncbi:hypothetical protein PHISP_03791 [Aspergillus sp. HF37]|nr:hypothetical protein PHISP_03791 [Aspergillus sp. HF37]